MSGRGYNGLTLWLDEDSDELILLDQTPAAERGIDRRHLDRAGAVRRHPPLAGAGARRPSAWRRRWGCTPAPFGLRTRRRKVFCTPCAKRRRSSPPRGLRRRTCSGRWSGRNGRRARGRYPRCWHASGAEALAIFEEDIAICRAIGENGLSLLKDGDTLLTHCNAGALAAVQYGTALAPVYVGLERGMRFRIYADETRPLLQGARLTCYELHKAGADVTLLCDGMAARLMQSGEIDAGDRRLRPRGAQLRFCQQDRHVIAGRSTPNTSACRFMWRRQARRLTTAARRARTSSSSSAGRRGDRAVFSSRKAPEGIGVYNPAFDVIPHTLVSAFITEKGVIRLG